MIISHKFIEDAFSKDYEYFEQQMNKLFDVIQFEAIKHCIIEANKNEQLKVDNPIKPLINSCINCKHCMDMHHDDSLFYCFESGEIKFTPPQETKTCYKFERKGERI